MKDLAEESDKTVHAMNKSGRKWQKSNSAKSKSKQEKGSESTGLCSYCGRTKHVGKQACPAKGKVCFKCNKLNHYSRMCKSKTVHEVEVPDDLNCEDGDFFIGVVNDVNQEKDEISVNLSIEDSNSIKVKLDTGAQVNVMPVQVYNSINTNKSNVLQPTKVKLTAYGGNNIPVIGLCQLKCKYKTEVHNLQFYVVDANAPTALGLKACQALSLIKVVMTVDKPDEMTKIDELIEEFSDVFSGQGCLSQEYDIQVKSAIKPVVHAARKLPVSMKEKVKKELDRMEKLKIIRRVDEPTDWVNSMVVVPKADGEVRICLDPRDLNSAIKREHYQMPTLNEITSQLTGMKYFTVLDATSGYWVVPLSRESSLLTTFQTPFGRFCYLRMPFGISSAQEVFQKRMDRVFGELPGST